MSEPAPRPSSIFVARALVILAVALLAGRILTVAGPFGANDVSRWTTVRALVERGTFSTGRRVVEGEGFRDEGIVVEPGWQSVDVALDPDSLRFYSSKPPLLSTLVAAEVWLVEKVTGWTLATDRAAVTQVVLLTFNALPLALALFALVGLVFRLEASDEARLFVVAATCFATFPWAFGIVLTNHVPAFAASLWTGVLLARALRLDDKSPRLFLSAGLASATVAALEPPALCLTLLTVALLARVDTKRALSLALPASLLPLAAYFVTAALVFKTPLFFHYRDNRWDRFPGSYLNAPVGIDVGEDGPVAYVLHFLIGHHGFLSLTPVLLLALPTLIAPLLVGVGDSLKRVYPAVLALAFVTAALLGRVLHREADLPLVVGLLPALALTAAALLLPFGWWRDERLREEGLRRVTLACSVAVLAFYVVKTKNYGGDTSGPRWVLWLVPLWLLVMPAPLTRLLERPGLRLAALVLVALSAISVAYGMDTPWRAPWLHALFR